MTRQLSSNFTMMFRIFLPTLWISFFGTFWLATLLSHSENTGPFPTSGLRLGLTIFFFVFLLIFWKTVFRLKRVDADGEFVYVTNFLKSVRYPHQDVDKIEIEKGFVFMFGTLVLKGKGRFGDRILFLLSRRRLELFLSENPQLADWLVEK